LKFCRDAHHLILQKLLFFLFKSPVLHLFSPMAHDGTLLAGLRSIQHNLAKNRDLRVLPPSGHNKKGIFCPGPNKKENHCDDDFTLHAAGFSDKYLYRSR